MEITVPELSLVVLVGASGSGKSTFAAKHFKATEILSSDACRALVSDDENDQTVTNQAFEVLHYIAGQRLALGKLVVVDATNETPIGPIATSGPMSCATRFGSFAGRYAR